MAQGLLYLDLRCHRKSALTSKLIGRSHRGAHAITHHGFDLRVERGFPGTQPIAGSRFGYAEISLDYMDGVAPHAYEQNGRVAEHYDPKRRYRARQASQCARS